MLLQVPESFIPIGCGASRRGQNAFEQTLRGADGCSLVMQEIDIDVTRLPRIHSYITFTLQQCIAR